MRFTDRSIKALKPASKVQDIKEDGRPGFYVRVFPSGGKSWVYLYRKDGVQRRMTFGTIDTMNLAEAHAAYEAARLAVKNGGDPAGELQQSKKQEKEADTVDELVSEYMRRWSKPRKRSWVEDQRILDKDVLPVWGKRKAQDITRRDVILLLDSIVDRGAPIMANKVHAVLHKMFRFAVGRDAIPFNPVADMPKPAKVQKRDRILSDAEINTHWHGLAAISVTTTTALLFQLLTAQRSGEVAAMRWDEIDGDVWTIPAEKAKNGLAHRVPLSPQAQVILDGLPKDSAAVFGIIHTAAGKTLARYLKRLGITKDNSEWFTPHDLRRTAATNMTRAGYNRLTVSKILNHVEGGVTAIYDRHSYDKEKRQALEAWGRKLEAIINGADESTVIPINRKEA
jgi:integrase